MSNADEMVTTYESPDGMVSLASRGGIVWAEAPLPARFHRCFVQTEGWSGFSKVERCACGAISMCTPGEKRLWLEKNARRKTGDRS